MKKLVRLSAILIIILSSFIFASCKKNYSGMEMEFFVGDSAVSSIDLILDENPDATIADFTKVLVRINGVKDEDIGELNVSTTNNIADITNYNLKGNILTFTLKAKRASIGGAKLQILHLRSDQRFSVDLNIQKRSNEVTLLNNNKTYLINLNKQRTTDTILINPYTLVSPNGTDKMYWAVKGTSYSEYIDYIGGQNKFTSIKINVPSQLEGRSITLYPVTELEGYSPVGYQDKTITVMFVSLPTIDEISTDVTIGDQVIAATSETTLNVVTNSTVYGDAIVAFGVSSGKADYVNRFYDYITCSIDRSDVDARISGSGLIVTSTNTKETATVVARLQSSRYIGEVDTVEKSFKIKALYSAKQIAVQKEGTFLSLEKDVASNGYLVEFDIFNNYMGADGKKALGVGLSFVPTLFYKNDDEIASSAGVDTAYSRIKLYINQALLYTDEVDADGNSLQNLFTSDGEAKDSLNADARADVELVFYVDGHIMKFFDNGDGYFVSEDFGDTSKVSVRYVTFASGQIDANLEFVAKNYYSRAITENVNDFLLGGKDDCLIASTRVSLEGVPTATALTGEEEETFVNGDTIFIKNNETLDLHIIAEGVAYDVPITLKVNADGLAIKDELDTVLGVAGQKKAEYWEYKDRTTNTGGRNSYLKIDATGVDVGIYYLHIQQEGPGYDGVTFRVVVYGEALSLSATFNTNNASYIYTASQTIGDPYYRSGAQYIVPYIDQDVGLSVTDLTSTGILYGYEYSFNNNTYDVAFKNRDEFSSEVLLNFGAFIERPYNVITLKVRAIIYKIDKHTSREVNLSDPTTYESVEIPNGIKIYVYNKIEASDLKITKDPGTKYSRDSLCQYDVNNEDTLYVDSILLNVTERKLYDIGSIIWQARYNYLDLLDLGDADVDWSEKEYEPNKISDYNYELIYKKSGHYEIIITVWQFDKSYPLSITVDVVDAVVTDAIKLGNLGSIYTDIDGERYIELKNGEEFTFELESQSSKGKVTNPGYVFVVCDDDGHRRDGFAITDNFNKKISVTSMDLDGKILLILARDAMKTHVEASGNSPESLLDENHPMAYISIRIYVTDGSPEHPHLIKSAKDFWEIGDDNYKCYRIMTDINLGNYNHKLPIAKFSGSITSKNSDTQANLFGLTLRDDGISYVFSDFYGTMTNVTFNVGYNYEAAEQNRGIFTKIMSSSVLENVCVVVTGNSKIKVANRSLVFGALVGENNGTIKYTNTGLWGVSGKLTIDGNGKKVIVGGLVGQNNGSITGTYVTTGGTNTYVFISSTVKSGYLSSITLEISKLSNDYEGAIGGLIGKNTGSIEKVAVIATINGDDTCNNLGGVIGVNDTDNTKTINEIKSASVVTGRTNIGGIIGNNKSGKITHCKYQIRYDSTRPSLSGVGNVGGIIGYADAGEIEYCSVFSYCWDYSDLTSISGNADIFSAGSIGGLVGGVGDLTGGNELNINKSSVNAYLKTSYIGGTGYGLAHKATAINTAYFIGRIDADTRNPISETTAGDTYSYYIAGGTITGIKGDTDNTDWNNDPNINGGCSYIVYDTDKSIFEIAPSTITLTIDSDVLFDSNTMLLEYYRFISKYNGLDVLEITADDTRILRALYQYAIDTILGVQCDPDGLGVVELMVKSKDTSVIDWASGNRFVVKGTGTTTITISSVLNPSVSASVDVVVIDALAQKYIITDISESRQALTEDKIGKGKSKLYYLSIDENGDRKGVNGTFYQYLPNLELGVNIWGAADYSLLAKVNNIGINTTQITVGAGKLISISVIERTDDALKLTFRPFIQSIGKVKDVNGDIHIDLYTQEGISDFGLDHTSKVLYPSETIVLNVDIMTDREVTLIEFKRLIEAYKDGLRVAIDTIAQVEVLDFDNVNNVQKARIVVSNDEEAGLLKQTLKFVFNVPDGRKYEVNYALLPERIDTISIQNYIVNDDNDATRDNVFDRPSDYIMDGTQNFMIIKMSPETGYFDYLEIRDVTGKEEFGFAQLKSITDLTNIKQDNTTSDKLGIRLIRGLDDNAREVYVKIALSGNNVFNHKLEIRAYAEVDGEAILLTTQLFDIFVQMMPEIECTQILPSGETRTITWSNGERTIYDARGVAINFIVDSRNADDWSIIEVENCNFTRSVGGYYTFIRNNDTADAVVQFRAMTTTQDGIIIEEFRTITFKLAEFVIYNASAYPTTMGRIYGHYDEETKIEFYFDTTDISYKDALYGAHNHVYSSKTRPDVVDPDTIEGQIFAILDALNNPNYSRDFVKLQNNVNDSKIQLLAGSRYSVIVKLGYNRDAKLAVTLNLSYDDTKKCFYYDITGMDPVDTVIRRNWTFNFQDVSEDKGTAVHNQDEFERMISGEKYYMANDFELVNYNPIDVELVWFDGDGHTLTIKSFAPLIGTDIEAGLFKQVYPNMLIKNLTLKYQFSTKRLDLCANQIDATSAKFGGITPLNEGMITNCDVIGSISLRASAIEVIEKSNYERDFYIGGIATINAEGATITHSSVSIKINALANVGGVVYSNNGVISSTIVKSAAQINTYNSNIDNTIVGRVGGFVVENNNRIYMSAVENSNAVKDIAAGFVYTNNGTIENSYAKVDSLRQYNNRFFGFVYENAGEISYSYSYINRGVTSGNTMFATSGIGISHCVEISNATSNGMTSSQVKIISPANIVKRDLYESSGFSFGSNYDGVWYIYNYPQLNVLREDVDETASTGSSENPYLVYDIDTWNKILLYPTGYVRVIRDIDFISINENPATSSFTFSGNIEGNGMRLDNILIYSDQDLDSIGLFAKLKRDSGYINTRVANLTLTTRQVTATKTKAVGILAGIVEDYKLYNIRVIIDSNDNSKVVIGGNAVGGVAGFVKGSIDIDSIYSTASVSSTNLNTKQSKIYLGYNNYKLLQNGNNLSSVYYAGSIFGIVDGYDATTVSSNMENKSKYFVIHNIRVDGDVAIIGDIVGTAIGFVGEYVCVDDVKVELGSHAKLKGQVFSGGIIGENRGELINADVLFDAEEYNNGSTVFTKVQPANTFVDTLAVGGAVGLNIGGLVHNVTVTNMFYEDNIAVGGSGGVGGIVCKNVNGTINNVRFNGIVSSRIIGLIAGEDTTGAIMLKSNVVTSVASGMYSIISSTENQLTTTPNYYDGAKQLDNLDYCIVDAETVDWYLANSAKFVQALKETGSTQFALYRRSAIGLLLGLDYKSDRDVYYLSGIDGEVIFTTGDSTLYTNHFEDSGITEIDIGSFSSAYPRKTNVREYRYDPVTHNYYSSRDTDGYISNPTETPTPGAERVGKALYNLYPTKDAKETDPNPVTGMARAKYKGRIYEDDGTGKYRDTTAVNPNPGYLTFEGVDPVDYQALYSYHIEIEISNIQKALVKDGNVYYYSNFKEGERYTSEDDEDGYITEEGPSTYYYHKPFNILAEKYSETEVVYNGKTYVYNGVDKYEYAADDYVTKTPLNINYLNKIKRRKSPEGDDYDTGKIYFIGNINSKYNTWSAIGSYEKAVIKFYS